jgi:hypothetical protein
MSDRTVTITFTGPLAEAGPPDTVIVLPVIEAFGDALRLMIRHRHASVTGHRPPYPALLSASALRLVSIDAGSCSVALELAGPVALGKLADAPRDGLVSLLSESSADIRSVPIEVAYPLRRIVDGLPESIASVAIAGSDGMPTLSLTRKLFDDEPPQMETLRYSGRLREVNWSRGTAVLGTWLGVCLLVFPPTMAEKMHEAGDRLISVTGTGERTPDGLAIIREIESVTIQEESGGRLKRLGPFEEDVQQALAIIRWEEKKREWFYDDVLDAWADELLQDALKE